jgi:hypothetical protein
MQSLNGIQSLPLVEFKMQYCNWLTPNDAKILASIPTLQKVETGNSKLDAQILIAISANRKPNPAPAGNN